MKKSHAGFPRAFFANSVIVLVASVLLLAWMGVLLFDLSEGSVVTASLATVGVGFMAIVARFGFKRPEDDTAAADARAAHEPYQPAVQDDADDYGAPGETPNALSGKRWSLDVFAAIDAKRFAAVCETWFSWAGFDTRSQAHRTDEGVDIWLHAARMPGPVAIVRCRHWRNKPVGLQDMKEFLGLVSTCQSAHGTYTTTSTYTPEALQFARENGIDAVDGKGLLRRIQTRTRQSQQALLAVAYSVQTS